MGIRNPGAGGCPTTLEAVEEAVVTTDARGRVVTWAHGASRLFGFTSQQVKGMHANALFAPEAQSAATDAFAIALSGTETQVGLACAGKNGQRDDLWLALAPLRDAQGEIQGTVCLVRRGGERDRSTKLLERATDAHRAIARLGQLAVETPELDALFAAAVETVANTLGVKYASVFELDRETIRLRFAAGYGWSQHSHLDGLSLPATNQSLAGYTFSHGAPVTVDDLARDQRFGIHPIIREHGIICSVSVPIGRQSAPLGVLSAYSDQRSRFAPDDASFVESVANVLASAIQRRTMEVEFRERSLHDPLTGLPNRALFSDRLAPALSQAQRERSRLALVLVDIDSFKLVNEGLGHAAGDELLGAFAARLQEAVRPSDTVARLGGDEFVVLCERIADEDSALSVAQRIGESWRRPFQVNCTETFLSATVGVAVSKTRTRGPQLMRDAESAMHRAKVGNRGGYELADRRLQTKALKRLSVESDLRRALTGKEFALAYQPVLDVSVNRPIAVEALVRWQHPQRGVISPCEFIPVAEESGLISMLGDLVLEEACRQLQTWLTQHPGITPLTVYVNICGRQLAVAGFSQRVADTLARTGLAPERLGLEITESTLLAEDAQTIATLTELESLGVQLILDDFGTGYSSLSRLSKLPLHALKIDRSFVADVHLGASRSGAITNAIISLGAALGIDVIAEGVETQAQLKQLVDLGCNHAQGYLLGRPVAASETERLLRVCANAPAQSARAGRERRSQPRQGIVRKPRRRLPE